jgi:hypothetical protein
MLSFPYSSNLSKIWAITAILETLFATYATGLDNWDVAGKGTSAVGKNIQNGVRAK